MRSLFLPLLLGTALFVARQPAAAQATLPLWPDSAVSATASEHETDTTTSKDDLIAGKRVQRLTGVSHPTLTVYPASGGTPLE